MGSRGGGDGVKGWGWWCHQLLVSSMGVQYQSKGTPPG